MFLDNIQPAPYQRHSATSQAAAIGIAPKAGTKRARRVELLAAKLIKDSGRTRKTVGGDEAVVWVAVMGGE